MPISADVAKKNLLSFNTINMESPAVYCELLNSEEVAKFEALLIKLGNKEFERPLFYASKPPYWYRKGLERGEGEDPLAAIILYGGMVMAGNRSVDGKKITSSNMQKILEFLIAFKERITKD